MVTDFLLDYISPYLVISGENNYKLILKFILRGNEMKKRKVVVKNIYLKIADMWKQYFLGAENPLFLSNDDQDLILAIGETYVKLITNRIGSTFRESESELELKFKMIKVVILKRTNSDIYEKALENVIEFKKKIEDKIIDKEYIEEMSQEMNN